MRLTLKIWRQTGPMTSGRLVDYLADDVSPDMSFLEMLDVVNEGLLKKGEDAIAFDSDCREGICGMCSLVVNGIPHGPDRGTTVCQLHMRRFKEGETDYDRAVAGKGVPRRQGPGRRSWRVRPECLSRWLRLGKRRRRARRERPADRQGHRRRGDGFGGMHGVRRLFRRMQECVCAPVHWRQALSPVAAAARSSRALPAGGVDGPAG